MTPIEMYKQMCNVLGEVNAVAGELYVSKVMEIDENSNENSAKNGNCGEETTTEDGFLDDQHLYFTPENGNVVFASAYDGWAFRIEDFAKIWATKANINENVLRFVSRFV